MVGLIFKILAFFAVVIVGILFVLNVTNAWNPGTLSLTPPDKAVCDRYAAANFGDREIRLTEVRWVWTYKNYGWGCYYEFGNLEVETVQPMPEI